MGVARCSRVPGTPLAPFASSRARSQSGTGDWRQSRFPFLVPWGWGSVGDCRGSEHQKNHLGPARGRETGTSCPLRRLERWPPGKLPFPRAANTQFCPAARARPPGPRLGRPRGHRSARPRRPGLPGEGGRTLSNADGPRARAAGEPGTAPRRERRAPGRGRCARTAARRPPDTPAWLPAGRWSGPRSWGPLVPQP